MPQTLAGPTWGYDDFFTNFDHYAVPVGPDLNHDEVDTSVELALFWGTPDLQGLADRVHKTNLLLLGGDYSISDLDNQGAVIGSAPVVSFKTTALSGGALDSSSMVIPSDYSKISNPSSPFSG